MSREELERSRAVRLRGVVFLAPGFDLPAGMEGQARRLARAVAAQGVPVTYVTTAPPSVSAPWHEVRGLVNLYRVPVSPHVDWPTTLALFEASALGLVAARRAALDAIYAVSWEFGVVAARLGAACGLPVVVKLACGGPVGDLAALGRAPDAAAARAALARVDRLVAISAQLEAEARDGLGLPAARIARLPNGVDPQEFKPRPGGGAPERPCVLFVGRLAEQKRVDVLLNAFARLAGRRPDVALRLAGDGPERAALERRAARLGLAGRVEWLGARDDVPALLAEATVLALPSSGEGVPNVALEAMAAGVPVVATDIPGTRDVVADGAEGLLLPAGDALALAGALERVLGDPALRERLGQAGRARAEGDLDLARVAAEHVALFEGLLRERAGAGADAHRRAGGSAAFGLTTIGRLALQVGPLGAAGVSVAGRLLGRAARSSLAIAGGRVARLGAGPGAARGVAILVRDVDGLGGMERQAMALARGLVARGEPVTLLTCTAPGAWALPARWEEVRDGVEVVRLPLAGFEAAAAAVLWARRDRWRVLYAVQLMMGAIGARLGRLLGAPVVVKLACARAEGDMAALARLAPPDRALVAADLAGCRIVCPSREVEAEALEAGLPAARVARIPNGVDLAAAARAAPVRPAGEGPTALFVGRLDRQKGLDRLLRAWPQVVARAPEARLLVAGEGPEEAALRREVEALGIGRAVVFLGRRDDVPGLLRGASVFVLPSRAEGLSNALLEAMAAGAAIVASDLPANREALTPEPAAAPGGDGGGDGGGEPGDDPCGVLVPGDDTDALARAVADLLLDPAPRAALGERARRRAAAFALDAVVAAYQALFAEAGGPRPVGPAGFLGRFARARGDDLARVAHRA